ncbi:MAG: hypothetical protein UR94_C0030G0010 [Parcubacteria group bacterium GW2011_GWA2_36_10]|nr:MAG: hypothetical protein UR94_C0030G0010 [Parcubacteria group bacterium GW2011_GWA2_36_10]
MKIDPDKIKEAFNIILINLKKNEPISYGEFYKLVGLDHAKNLDRLYGSQLLEEINTISGKNYMISAFAVSSDEYKPYNGFYLLAEKLGRIRKGSSEAEKDAFWIEEMARVYNKYKDN